MFPFVPPIFNQPAHSPSRPSLISHSLLGFCADNDDGAIVMIFAFPTFLRPSEEVVRQTTTERKTNKICSTAHVTGAGLVIEMWPVFTLMIAGREQRVRLFTPPPLDGWRCCALLLASRSSFDGGCG